MLASDNGFASSMAVAYFSSSSTVYFSSSLLALTSLSSNMSLAEWSSISSYIGD